MIFEALANQEDLWTLERKISNFEEAGGIKALDGESGDPSFCRGSITKNLLRNGTPRASSISEWAG